MAINPVVDPDKAIRTIIMSPEDYIECPECKHLAEPHEDCQYCEGTGEILGANKEFVEEDLRGDEEYDRQKEW